MDDLFADFAQFSRNHRHSKPGTIDMYLLALRAFFAEMKLNPDDVTTADINDYIGRLKATGRSINTQRLRQAAVKMFFHWYCNEVNTAMHNPAETCIPIREERKIPNVLTPADLIKMVYACDLTTFAGRRDAAIICLLADTGIRLGECAKLKVGNIKEMETHLVLNVPRVKTYERSVPFCKMEDTRFVSEFFMSYYLEVKIEKQYSANHPLFITDGITISGTALKKSGIYGMITRVAKRAGVRCTPHSFRHFFGTYSIINGTDIMDLRELMGHALLETTMRYVHIANVLEGKALAKTATAGIMASKHNSGFVKIYRDSGRSKKKSMT